MADQSMTLVSDGTKSPPARLRRRSEFLQAARGTRVHLASLTLQASRRKAAAEPGVPDQDAARVGLTVTKKTGRAVERNRIRRRLREALRHAKALSTEPNTDYVVVARREVLTLGFDRLIADLQAAVRKAGSQLANPRGSGKAKGRPTPP